MAGNVGESDDQAAVGKGLPIVVVTTGFIGGLVPARDGVAGYLRSLLRKKGLLDIASDLEIVVDPIELTFGFRFADSGFDVFADFPGHGTGNKTRNKKNDGVQANIRLGDWRGPTWNRWRPTEMDSSEKIRDGGGNAGEPADPLIQAKDGENDEDKKEKSGRTGDRAVDRVQSGAGQESDADGRDGRFQNGGRDPENFGKILADANGAVDEAQHEVFVGGNEGGKAEIPAGMSVVESGVKQKDASSENYDNHGNENEDAEDADTFALKFGETERFGLKFLLRHGMNRAIIRR